MRSIFKRGALASFGLLPFAAFAPAQYMPGLGASGDNEITAVGIVNVERAPEIMRVQLEVSASGKTAKDALKALGDLQDADKKKLIAMGAAEGDIHFDDPELNPATPDRQRQEMMMNRHGKKTAAAPPTVVGGMLKVEFPLKKGTASERLLAVADLEKSIDDADLAGKKLAAKTPEDEESQEENSGENSDSTNGVAYLFVTKLSADDRAKAYAEAFGKAKEHAAEIAKAAGADLGALRQLSSESGPDEMGANYYGGEESYALRMAMMQVQQRATDAMELIGTQPGKASGKIAVNASFAIK